MSWRVKEPDADANHDGYVTGTELGLFLQQKMTNLSNNRQTPRYGKLNAYGYDRGDFVFQVGKPDVPSIAASPTTQSTSEAERSWAAAKETTSTVVLEAFIRRYADSFYAELARARLEELKRSRVAVVAPPATPPPSAVAEAEKAADSGDANAMVNLGLMYENGNGIAQDYAEAVRWYRKAADAGYALGMSNLGTTYRDGKVVVQDDAEAVRWFRKAADDGSAMGMVNLGWMFENGKGVAKDDAEAVRWYRKAADVGEPLGFSSLGVMYDNGKGVAKDDAEAVRWYRKAADADIPVAMNNLGTMYRDGTGVQGRSRSGALVSQGS
jgi:hypothetical protein